MNNTSIPRPRRAWPVLAAATPLLALTGLCATPTYPAAVARDGALGYYRFNDLQPPPNVNENIGSLGSSANATNLNTHLVPGAIAGDSDHATYFDSSARSIIPWNAGLNPDASQSFTIEAWFYPTSDKVAGSFVGPAPIMNRYSYSGVNRQGWVYFQRNPDETYTAQSAVGWNFRTYVGTGSTTGINVTSGKPYKLGAWQHVVTVWDGPAQTATMYIDGVEAASQVWTAGGPAYQANTGGHPSTEAPNGDAGLCLGSYNNTETGNNPFRGAIDEVALYNTKLSASQILAHYQNATNVNRTTAYAALVQADAPVGYWRMNDGAAGAPVAVNSGLLQNNGHAETTAEVRKHIGGAGSTDSAYAFHYRNGSSAALMPFKAENNPDATVPFTVEAWFRPTSDRQNPGACPVNNRYVASGNRTGWVFFQRAPNDTYSSVSGYSGVGWTFRMFTGLGGSGQDVTSNLPYTVGEWQHVVVTWDGVSTGIMYVNGVEASRNESMTYAANTDPAETGDPADLAIGGYNRASGLGGNPFEGDIDEFAIYNGIQLTPEQALAHYQAGTNAHPEISYETLVLTAGYDGAGTQALQPATYLRFNELAPSIAANAGSLGRKADAQLLLAQLNVAGPITAGFEGSNTALNLDGVKGWAGIDNIAGLNLSGHITLEAWIKPGATQGAKARILSHGPATLSNYIDVDGNSTVETNGWILKSSEVFLRLEENGARYAVGSSDGTAVHGVSAEVPAGDLGSTAWIHLVGTYDGANWRLYRNGAQIASASDAVGALPLSQAGWAIGSSGNGWADPFAGAIDEVAIYGSALSASQVATHYAGGAVDIRLSISKVGNGYQVSWPSGTLQQSDNVAGGYADVAGASSPYTIPGSTAKKFYRVRQ
jgi:hypothetical protein